MNKNQKRKGKAVTIDLHDDANQDNMFFCDDNDGYNKRNTHQDDDNMCGNDGSDIATDSWQNFVSSLNKSLNELTSEDVCRLKFNSIEEGETFYNTYAKVLGFSIRKDDLIRDKNNMVVSRRWVCSREGQRSKKHLERLDRQREPKALTRVGCLATFCIKYDKGINQWFVKDFVNEHNHFLVEPYIVQYLHSHRSVKSPDKAQLHAMRRVGVKTSQVMDYMASQSGGYEKVGFTQKDLYNHVDAERRREIHDGDAETALAYFCGKSATDPSFYYKYEVDEENRLSNLFWADSISRLDFACFGDVLVFDTTYRINAYRKPFVILAGANHHRQTTIFACALLSDETIETYTWVLQMLLDAMNNKKPISVITDGDKAMRKAIKRVLPEARHRLCTWHLERNAVSNVHNPNFAADFKKCMLTRWTTEEFESRWKEMVDEYGLHDNQWIAETYLKRFKWAEAYLQGHFFGWMRSTQRCEGMNAYFKRFLSIRLKLYEFVQQCDRILTKLRQKEMGGEFKTNHTEPVLCTSLISIERNAANLLTREIFFKFREELKLETLFFIVNATNMGDSKYYTLSRFRCPESTWTVVYSLSDRSLKCSCLKFESDGIPCSHMICIMKAEHMEDIPPSCIMKRWTKYAKSNIDLTYNSQIIDDAICDVRFGALNSSCRWMSYFASRSSQGFDEANSTILGLTGRMEKLCILNGIKIDASMGMGLSAEELINCTNESKHANVLDPVSVKTKGSSAKTRDKMPKQRRCSNCKDVGHTIRKCTRLSNHSSCAFLEGSESYSQQISTDADIIEKEPTFDEVNCNQTISSSHLSILQQGPYMSMQSLLSSVDGRIMQTNSSSVDHRTTMDDMYSQFQGTYDHQYPQ